ncbi:MurR/RpiR family transcriptional regulator [Devosia rhodophyticola]|uniref:MurR/RpiR family transcriptional regulator n=1 Tax=Devosia rhodophyticola TaxID=3026423 RepID=A0ABY7YZZ8_9HYPH|nr:MurR/RpiR family transcriptional regulator [Devosia rhodophyticola]WDR06827.1 MurR/RpiR family transcriptional regulator [Devosia rhodophyticola]
MINKPTVERALPDAAIDVISRMQRAEDLLSPAETRVAAAVRQDYDAAMRLTIAELASRAGVSQPTVTRFARSLGCASFNDFKISLATTLAVASAYLNSDRVFEDDVGQLAKRVMQRAANAVRDCLEQLDTVAVGQAINAMAAARRIDIYGQGGGSAVMAEDSKLRLFRLGIPVAAYTDGHQQRMSAATLQPGDVVFAISNSGRSKAVVEAAKIAASFGATTIGLTRPDTPLASAVAITIPIVIAEDDDVLAPTPSRYAHMAVIDTLATGVANRLGEHGRQALRRVRYTLSTIGIAIPTPSTDPALVMDAMGDRE